MRGLLITITLAGLGLGQAEFASAQRGAISLEGRIAANVPTGDLSSAGAGVGLGLGAEFMISVQNNLTAYLSASRHEFGCPQPECEFNGDLRSTGFGMGLKYIFPSPRGRLIWARGGIMSGQLSTPDASGERDVGFELGMGADIDVARRLAIVPHVSFINHTGAPGNTVPPALRDDFTTRYLTIGLAAHLHFH
jgi:hypothetical protein